MKSHKEIVLENSIQWKILAPFGPVYLVSSDKGIVQIALKKCTEVALVSGLSGKRAAFSHLKEADRQLSEYFSGKRTEFNLKLDSQGTVFQKTVWAELKKIPFGNTVSYKDIASRIRNPKAFRAVGLANSKNPFCIVVPCHRVIAADGKMGGYSGGLKLKKFLLQHEGCISLA